MIKISFLFVILIPNALIFYANELRIKLGHSIESRFRSFKCNWIEQFNSIEKRTSQVQYRKHLAQ